MPDHERRYLIRLAHRGDCHPQNHTALLERIRQIVRPLQGSAVNLRVSRQALEFDLFCATGQELHPFLSALEAIGPILTYRQLDVPPAPQPAATIMAEARALFNEERYWEVHEALEIIWKKSHGSEKNLVQGLILTAAALVHAQRNETHVMDAMLEDALRRLDQQQPATYLGLDVRQFVNHVKKLKIAKSFHFPAI